MWAGVLVETQRQTVVKPILLALARAQLSGTSVSFVALKGRKWTWALMPFDRDDHEAWLDGLEVCSELAKYIARTVKARSWCFFNSDRDVNESEGNGG